MKPKLKMGMVGGGREGTIGVVHQTAAQLDGKIELVAGAFSSDGERSRQAGKISVFTPRESTAIIE